MFNKLKVLSMENQIQKQEQRPIDLIKAVIDAPSVQEQFKNALGEHKDAFVASLIDLFTGDKQLQKCNPSLIVYEALRAATLHLPLNKALGFAYIIVFNNSVKNEDGSWSKVPTPTFVLGYKGYIQLAMRTGQYRTINSNIVYEGEVRKVSKLTGEIEFDGERKSDKIVGYFCYFELLNGFSKTLYVTIEEMAEYALHYSPSFKRDPKKKPIPTVQQLVELANRNAYSKEVGWEGNFNDMAMKTVIRRLLSKYGYLSVEMQNALSADMEDSQSSRNEMIDYSANSQVIDIDTLPVEEVGQKSNETSESGNKEEEPNY